MTAAEKGRTYVAEGRLTVHEIDEHGGVVMASCRGDGAVWTCGRDEHGWFCDCPARSRCGHLFALGLVVALEPRETA